MAPVPARDAATIALVRDASMGIEVLLVQRHAESRFAPGAFAFPGGRIEAEDALAGAERYCRGLTAAAAASILQDIRPTMHAIGFWIGALRELFEETGLLLAYEPSGAPLGLDDEWRARLRAYRVRCRLEASAFRTMLAEAGLTLATDRMAYYARWITPEERPIRYDARFFVAEAFGEARAEPDGIEVVDGRWLTPEAALGKHGAGEITLPFVTQRILGFLAGHGSVTALLRAAHAREIHPIRPRLVLVDGEERILMPGDPGYF
ncbi:MAG: NUDIX hydrolase [Candidatus Rokuibacteriota bacterium]